MTVEIGLKLCTFVFYPSFKALLWESYLVSWMKVLVNIMSFSYWGVIFQLEVESEIYGFSKVDQQMVLYEGRNQCLMDQTEVI